MTGTLRAQSKPTLSAHAWARACGLTDAGDDWAEYPPDYREALAAVIASFMMLGAA